MACDTTVQRKVAQMNIDRFERMLSTERDETKRQTLVCLLQEQEEKLALLLARSAPVSALIARRR